MTTNDIQLCEFSLLWLSQSQADLSIYENPCPNTWLMMDLLCNHLTPFGFSSPICNG